MSRGGATAARLVLAALVGCALPEQGSRAETAASPRSRAEPAPELGFGDAPSDAAALVGDPALPPTRLAQEIFGTADVALLGRVASIAEVGLGTGVLRVRVDERLMGPVRAGDELVVLGYASDFLPGARTILFLRRFRDGPRFEVVRRVDADDPDFAAKLAVTRRTAALLAIAGARERDSAAFELVLASLSDETAWTRRYGLAELGWLASTRTDLFSPLRRERLEALALATTDRDVRAGVESVTMALAPRPVPLPAPPRQESSSP